MLGVKTKTYEDPSPPNNRTTLRRCPANHFTAWQGFDSASNNNAPKDVTGHDVSRTPTASAPDRRRTEGLQSTRHLAVGVSDDSETAVGSR